MPAKKNNRRSSKPKSQPVTPRSQRANPRLDQEAIDDQKFQQKLDAKRFTAGLEREANEQLQCPGCGSSTWRMKPIYYVYWAANELVATMVCHFDMLLPFRISVAQSYSLFNNSLSSLYATPFAVVPLEHDSTWVSLNESLPTLSRGEITLILRSDPAISAIEEPGKLTALLTFWGPLVSKGWMNLADRMRAIGSEVVFVQVKTLPLFVVYSLNSVLSSDTYPPPLQLFSTPSINGAKWVLNFTNPLPAFGQSIIVSVSDPSAASRRDLLFFAAGLLTATGVTGLFEVLRDYLKRLSQRE